MRIRSLPRLSWKLLILIAVGGVILSPVAFLMFLEEGQALRYFTATGFVLNVGSLLLFRMIRNDFSKELGDKLTMIVIYGAAAYLLVGAACCFPQNDETILMLMFGYMPVGLMLGIFTLYQIHKL